MYREIWRRSILFPAVALLMFTTSCGEQDVFGGKSHSGDGYDIDDDDELGEEFRPDLVEDEHEYHIRVHFPFDSSELDKQSHESLREIARELSENDSYQLRVVGHCDIRGGPEYNFALGERRANSIKKFLVMHHNIDPDRIEVSSMGSRCLEDNGTSEESHGKNRRATFVLKRPAHEVEHYGAYVGQRNPVGDTDWGMGSYEGDPSDRNQSDLESHE